MKKVSSIVWQFFDRLEEDNRCVAVLCKLCDSEYKYFGNTTNLRTHLIKKHPLQWEFRQKNSDGSKGLEQQPTVRAYDEDSSTSAISSKRRKYTPITSENVMVEDHLEMDQADIDEDTATLNLVRRMHNNQESDEEWLEEDYINLDVFDSTRKKPLRKVKREVITPTRNSTTLTYIPHGSKPNRTEQKEIKDEYSVFGEYIANKLRKFKTPRTRGNIQQIITTILWQAEYGLYDDAEAVKRVLMSSIQYSEVDQQVTVQDSKLDMTNQLAENLVQETNESTDAESSTLME